MRQLQAGQRLDPGTLVTTVGTVRIPDAENLVHLQFRRFAGCPFCSVHLRAFARRHAEIAAAGIREVVVFRSTATALQQHHGDLPFALVADPEDRLYNRFGVGSGWRALLDPRALLMALPRVVRMLPRLPGLPPWGRGALGLPADFLIAPDGTVLACRYGTHADDQWSVDELLAHAGQRIDSGHDADT